MSYFKKKLINFFSKLSLPFYFAGGGEESGLEILVLNGFIRTCKETIMKQLRFDLVAGDCTWVRDWWCSCVSKWKSQHEKILFYVMYLGWAIFSWETRMKEFHEFLVSKILIFMEIYTKNKLWNWFIRFHEFFGN